MFDHIGYPFDGDRLQVVHHHVTLPQRHTGKTVQTAHLGCGHHHAAHAVIGTHINTVCLRDQHADMNDVPGSVNRGIKFQFLWKKDWKLCLICLYSVHSLPQMKLPSLNLFVIILRRRLQNKLPCWRFRPVCRCFRTEPKSHPAGHLPPH